MSLTNLKPIECHNGFALLEVPLIPTPVWLIVPPGGEKDPIDFSDESYLFYLDPTVARSAFDNASCGIEPAGKLKGIRWSDMVPLLVSH